MIVSLLVEYDKKLLEKYDYLIGIDEVGRGCLAGPLVVCGVVINSQCLLKQVKDSKKLNGKQREQLNQIIIDSCLEYTILEIPINEVDELNIYQATRKAMNEIAQTFTYENSLILSDAMKLDVNNNLSLIKGDDTSSVIACASILAKVYRDNLMKELACLYPQYDFENNKGYATKKHILALEEHGFIEEVHRKSFEPIKSMCSKQLKLF